MAHPERHGSARCRSCATRMARSLPWLRHHPLLTTLLTSALLALLVVQLMMNVFVSGSYQVKAQFVLTSYFNNTALSPRTGRGLLTQGHAITPVVTFNLYHKMGLPSLFRLLRGEPEVLPPCLFPPPNLVSQVSVSYQSLSWQRLEDLHPEVNPGGKWRPDNCTSRHRVAIIVPYRDRTDHLNIFLKHIHPFLQKQRLQYGIYIVEQDPYNPFNRGLLLNIGYREAMADDVYDCAIFHDIDLLPENEHNLYSCPDQPRHMSVAVDELAYRLPYAELFGGVEAFRKDHFELINGFSNLFFGWGGEDDDLYSRLKCRGLNITRYSAKVARYSMMRHRKNIANPARFLYLKNSRERLEKDGLNSLIYKREKFEKRKLFTWIYVRVNQTAIMNTINMSNVESKQMNASH